MSSLYFGHRDDAGTSVFEGTIDFSDENFNRAMGALSTDPVIGFSPKNGVTEDGVPFTTNDPATPEEVLQNLVVFVRETIFAKVNGILQEAARKAAIEAADAQFTPVSEEK
jgi:hypothetical protein